MTSDRPLGIRRLFRLATSRGRVAADVDAELAFHLEATEEELRARGLAPGVAREEARRRLGDLAALRAELGDLSRHREARVRRLERWRGAVADLARAARTLRREPGFAALVAITLALGIGANATMFGVVDQLLLRPAPHVRDDGALSLVYFQRQSGDFGVTTGTSASYPTFEAIRAQRALFDDAAGWWNNELSLGRGEGARRSRVILVTPNYFSILGVRAARGRFFSPDDWRDGAAPVAVVTWGFAHREFGDASAAVGRSLRVGERQYTVVGVAPDGFSGVEMRPAELFVPVAAAGPETAGRQWRTNIDNRWTQVVVRRRPGVTEALASTELTATYRTLNREWRKADSAAAIVVGSVVPARRPGGTAQGRMALWLGGVSVLVLLVACANVTNLLLGRGQRRRRELAVRLALGAGRGRLMRQLLGESVMLAALGGAVAMLAARWGSDLLRATLLSDLALPASTFSLRLAMLTAIAVLASGVVAGLIPALLASRVTLTESLKSGAREGGGRRSRLRPALIVAQASLSLVLLVGAGLFVQSFVRASRADIGLATNRLVVAHPDFSRAVRTRAEYDAMWLAAAERVSAVPGVERASLSVVTPFYSQWTLDHFLEQGDTVPAARSGRDGVWVNAVTPGYFATLGTPILVGRAFTAEDRTGSPEVVIVNETMARETWPGENPLGKCLRARHPTAPCATVVGVARNTHEESLRRGDLPQAWYVLGQRVTESFDMRALFVRVRGDASEAVPLVRQTLQRMSPDLDAVSVSTVRSLLDPEIRPWRLGAAMFGLFGALALVVAALGMYSVVVYEVTQRRHEIGVRMAMGARASQVARLIVRDGTRPVLLGIALGSFGALAVAPLVAPMLYRTSPRDPAVYASVALVLVAAAVLAAFVPARRASRLDPVAALRDE